MDLNLETLNLRLEAGPARADLAGPIFMISLMIGTVIYVGHTCFQNYKK